MRTKIPILMMIIFFVVAWHYKHKKTEVIVFIAFIIGTLSFYSLFFNDKPYSEVYYITGDIQERYMIPNFVLFSMLFGFIVNRIWKINFKNNPSRINLQKSFRIVFISILVLFLLASFSDSTIGKSLSDRKIPFTSPAEATELISTRTIFPENSILIGDGKKAIFLGAIPFYTNYGFEKNEWNPQLINYKDIQILQKILDDGYDVYANRIQNKEESVFFDYLESEYGLILYPNSDDFCKLEKINITTGTKLTDQRCLLGIKH